MLSFKIGSKRFRCQNEKRNFEDKYSVKIFYFVKSDLPKNNNNKYLLQKGCMNNDLNEVSKHTTHC